MVRNARNCSGVTLDPDLRTGIMLMWVRWTPNDSASSVHEFWSTGRLSSFLAVTRACLALVLAPRVMVSRVLLLDIV